MKVKIYLMKYELNGRKLVFSQSLDRDMAFALGKLYARQGRKPVIIRIDADHKKVIACGEAFRLRIA